MRDNVDVELASKECTISFFIEQGGIQKIYTAEQGINSIVFEEENNKIIEDKKNNKCIRITKKLTEAETEQEMTMDENVKKIYSQLDIKDIRTFAILEIQNNDQTIKLIVKSGLQKPYLYKSKAYKRNDTATIEVDTLEFSRLILDGKNIRFEELPCRDQNLTFDVLHRKLAESIQIFAGGFLRLLFFCFIQIIRVLVSIADCDRLNRMTICKTPLTILWHTNTI